jgi:hypothetical protein
MSGRRGTVQDTDDRASRLLGKRKPFLMVTDPPYGIELDSEWRDKAGLNRHGATEHSYVKKRTKGHKVTSIAGDTRADWSDAFALVPSLEVGYVMFGMPRSSPARFSMACCGSASYTISQIIWDKGRAVLTRTHYWFQHEPCWYVRKINAPWYGKPGENSTIWSSPSPKFMMGGSDEDKFDHPTQKPVELMRRPILNHAKAGELVFDPFLGSGTTLVAAETTGRVCCGLELDPKYVDVVVERWQALSGKRATLEGDGRTFGRGSTGPGEGGGMTKKVVGIESGAKNKVRGRPFAPGNRLGRGRPKGSGNKVKPGQALLDDYAEPITRKCIALAMRGDRSAMRICMERISPARRGASIQMNLPPIKTAADVDRAAEKVTQAIRRGNLTPTEGATMMSILESRSRVFERVQLEGRLDKVEAGLANADLSRAA